MYKYKAIKVDGRKVDEHRYIMEQHLGRKLSVDEVVHHRDHNKRNNSLSNLEVMTRAEHARLHARLQGVGRKLKETTIEKLRTINRSKRESAKLSIEQVVKVRELINAGKRSCEVAKIFGVSKFVICRIKTNKATWWL